ncbi:unnamed protein product [Phytophthora fragariaefolia]|uniref:Unnamed protein product n=1 Tax=Phytophthora fragariaefolia TaxID=1490495 RepID=A0A9W7D4E5_9STRA|nr:unnamed protein product [Phytophthora fragariaefolia]
MEYERGAEDLPVDTNKFTGSPNAAATHVAREDCPHLADPVWEALQRLSTVIGEAAVATMLRTLSPTEQHGVALGFIMKEQREVAARATVSAPSTPRVESLKRHVNSYVGRESEPLLRWLVEVDTAITARRIVDPLLKVAFAMSCLGGRARGWASRAEFLDLQQGKHDVHAYSQRARYLVSNIVTNPIDEATKAVTFMKGLKDGPVKTYLVREYPSTLVREKCEPNQKTQIRSDLRGSRSVKGDAVVSTVVDTQVEQEWPVTEGSDLGASAPGADAIGTNIKGRSAVRRRVRREYKDVLPDDIPAELPQDKSVQHEIDLVPGTKYCVTRQWPLPREQVKAIDDIFESRRKAGQVRESKSPHSAPTFCVKKAQDGWRIVHAYNKLNDATVPAQTPIRRKDVIIDSMALSNLQ